MSRLFLWISAIAASVVALDVILQVYFVTAWVFGEGDALDAHRVNGIVIWAASIAVGISGLVAYWRAWGRLALSVALPVLAELQIVVVGSVDDTSENVSGWIHGLHGGLAILVFMLAGCIAYRDLKALGVRARLSRASA